MRPINKGTAPRVYTDYHQAKDDLRDRLSSYCSYCEMNISNGMDIEHVSPKSKNPELANDWDNFLIACKFCNRIKSNDNTNRDGYIFPDTHNTAYAYSYTKTKVKVNELLNTNEKLLAQNTIDLIDINREKDSTNRKDDRFVARLIEWDKAQESLEDYQKNSSEEMIRQIARSHSGFISSWLTIFENYTEVKQELLNRLSGTAMECYDSDIKPVERLSR